ncbi:MAG TPA: porin family protein [Flavobacterium sp.]|nr:porin family protein [Flavobacterium sp.]
MKKTFFITATFFLLTLSIQAQLLQFGLKAGLNYSNFSGTEIQTDAITSYHAGLISEIKLSEKFAIQPELLYTTQGATYETILGDIDNELGYIAIPVLAKIYFSKSFSLELGPQASFLLSEKNDFDTSNSNTFDFAIDAGLSLKITKSIFLQGRYILGLTEVSPNAEAKNSVLQFSAGLLF